MSFDDSSMRKAPALEPFQVMRRTGLYIGAALLALAAAAAVGAAAFLRGPVWLYVPAGILVIFALVALPGVTDAKTPIFVADEYGVRLHNRDTWIGLLWNEMGVLIVEPRNGFAEPRIKIVAKDGGVLGAVTSGVPSPSLGYSIAMGYVPPAESAIGTKLDVEVRGKPYAAEVVSIPFVKNGYHRKPKA